MSKTDGQTTSEKMQADGSMCMLPPLADSSPVTPAGNSQVQTLLGSSCVPLLSSMNIDTVTPNSFLSKRVKNGAVMFPEAGRQLYENQGNWICPEELYTSTSGIPKEQSTQQPYISLFVLISHLLDDRGREDNLQKVLTVSEQLLCDFCPCWHLGIQR